jgi:alkylation response protein AidB-like acyl-CoA dehydrogenase
MIDTAPIRAFLDDKHVALAEEVTKFTTRLLAPLAEPADDAAARHQARDLLGMLGAAGWFEPIRDQDWRACCLIREALGATSPLADAVFALQAPCPCCSRATTRCPRNGSSRQSRAARWRRLP